ncbi:MAG TPA: type II toxin-antitoxin system VapC family toxin [Terracidiphilus sp.]|nr:type II toxin-antitoxin system VapC family toxin [Terracidiphilus sp.]
MIAAVADTHTAIWHLFADERLSPAAASTILDAANSRQKIAISSITLVEIVYLVEKGRLPQIAITQLKTALGDPGHVFTEAGLTSAIVESMVQVPREQVPDMPDRVIAATALHLGVPVITRDRKIRASNLKSIW